LLFYFRWPFTNNCSAATPSFPKPLGVAVFQSVPRPQAMTRSFFFDLFPSFFLFLLFPPTQPHFRIFGGSRTRCNVCSSHSDLSAAYTGLGRPVISLSPDHFPPRSVFSKPPFPALFPYAGSAIAVEQTREHIHHPVPPPIAGFPRFLGFQRTVSPASFILRPPHTLVFITRSACPLGQMGCTLASPSI